MGVIGYSTVSLFSYRLFYSIFFLKQVTDERFSKCFPIMLLSTNVAFVSILFLEVALAQNFDGFDEFDASSFGGGNFGGEDTAGFDSGAFEGLADGGGAVGGVSNFGAGAPDFNLEQFGAGGAGQFESDPGLFLRFQRK
ncbi:hypothetical protein CDAR_518761 [Caerostris darwini]|uniref:Uncharacterized protein n=1 Tax=Caerostris darwini TaxID=1538125 RepID=A0AAV4PT18_9ARAC|nr:hypothetical protein CDAR_518761 [Caerostris darwini]